MKTVLYIGESYLGYEQEVKKLIEEVLNYRVIYLDLTKYEYSYRNSFERIYTKLFFKLIKKQDFKKEKMIKSLIEDVKKIEKEIDIIFYIRATDRMEKFIKYLHGLNKEMIYHQWDSLKKIKDSGKCVKYFHKASSFDKENAQKLGIKFIPNFYLNKDLKEKEEIKYEVFTIISHGKNGKRIDILEKLAEKLKKGNISYKFLVFTKEKIKSKNLTIIDKPISIDENYKLMKQSKIILEIGDKINQGGLTFRAIDSLGLRKKLITNYDFIKNYEFYNSNNIYILKENIDEDILEFFKKEYKPLPEKIYEKYSGEFWIKNIFEGI